MTAVVTGATGHIGANLVRALLARGEAVRALVHVDRRAMEGLEVEVVNGDICNLDCLCEAFEDADVVYHLAARISLLMDDWQELEKTNVMGTRNVVEACLRCGVRRLIHFSSIHALVQEPLDRPVDEARSLVDSQSCPPYDRSKAAGEREVLRGMVRGLDAIIINPTAVIGPYDYHPSHFGEVLLMLAQHKMPALVSSGFDWVDVRDVVSGAIHAAEHAPAGAKYLLSGQWASVRELAKLVEEITGVSAPRLTFPIRLAGVGAPFARVFSRLNRKRPLFTSVSLRVLSSSNRSVCHEKATQELGYQPRPLKETLADTIKWFEENGYLAKESGKPG